MDEFGLLVWGGAHAHGDDEGVLVAEGGDEGAGVGVIDFLDADARGHGGGAAFAGDGGDVVLARGEEGFHDVFAACAAGLGGFWLAFFFGMGIDLGEMHTPTIATFLMWFEEPDGRVVEVCWAMFRVCKHGCKCYGATGKWW